MIDDKFIITDDECTKNKLLELGLKLISQSSGFYTFESNTTLNFSLLDSLKFVHTNTLSF